MKTSILVNSSFRLFFERLSQEQKTSFHSLIHLKLKLHHGQFQRLGSYPLVVYN